jgi:hypothetical protein
VASNNRRPTRRPTRRPNRGEYTPVPRRAQRSRVRRMVLGACCADGKAGPGRSAPAEGEIAKLDRRYKPPKEYEAVECEAIGQVTLQMIIRTHIEALLPEPIEDVRVRERRQRETVRKLLARAKR